MIPPILDTAVKQIQEATGKSYAVCLVRLRRRVGNAVQLGNGLSLAANVAATIAELKEETP